MDMFDEGKTNVSLMAMDDGSDRIALQVGNGGNGTMMLTPGQARALANELISVVNRVEVKANLKVSSNMRRRQSETPAYKGDSRHHLATAG